MNAHSKFKMPNLLCAKLTSLFEDGTCKILHPLVWLLFFSYHCEYELRRLPDELGARNLIYSISYREDFHQKPTYQLSIHPSFCFWPLIRVKQGKVDQMPFTSATTYISSCGIPRPSQARWDTGMWSLQHVLLLLRLVPVGRAWNLVLACCSILVRCLSHLLLKQGGIGNVKAHGSRWKLIVCTTYTLLLLWKSTCQSPVPF